MSNKQKLNTCSSTEAELVGVDDAMPRILWTSYFLQAQGYDTQPSTLFQDNQITILLENNGTALSSKYTQHIISDTTSLQTVLKRMKSTLKIAPRKR
jgi:hypothetical protein